MARRYCSLGTATQPLRTPTGTMAFIPPHGTATVQSGQVIPGTFIHTPGVVQYTGQPLGSPNNQSPQNPRMRLWEKLYKAESKTLGAIQILIGLMHIGFGGASISLADFYYWVTSSSPAGPYYFPLTAIAGYPFWGGLFFIVSGSLSVSAENQPNSCLVQCSVGFNITSSIMALTGITLYILELTVFGYLRNFGNVRVINPLGVGLAVLLLLFSFLEFCITVSTAHFGCQAACCTNDQPMVFVPYPQNIVIPVEGSLPPPASHNMESDNVESSSMRNSEERT